MDIPKSLADIPKSTEKAASWVPQVFFDFIARIAPGAVLLLVGVVCFYGPSGFPKLVQDLQKLQSVPAVALALVLPMIGVLSYSLAICLWGSCYLAFLASKPLSKVLQNEDPESSESFEAYRHEAIRHYDPVAGTRLTKIKAEVQFSSVLMGGLTLAAVFCLVKGATETPSLPWIEFGGAFFFGAVGAAGALVHFRRRARQVSDECIRFLKEHRKIDIMASLSPPSTETKKN